MKNNTVSGLKKRMLFLTALVFMSVVSPLYAQKNGKLVLDFNHIFNGQAVDFNSVYKNAHGETLKISLIAYFISNIQLIRTDGSRYVIPQDDSYFLIKHTTSAASTSLILPEIPEGEYSGISFLIGVDSLRNTVSIEKRTGTLDVGGTARGMYWVWNSGYIFFKLEGTSEQAPERLQHKFAYHIGGYGGYRTPTINSLRSSTLNFSPFKISAKKQSQLSVNVNLDKFFAGSFDLRIADLPNLMWGAESEKIADNYLQAFEPGKK
jgi:hypothetical protein